jgi:ParB-like chromosome segregation protein Spo0J
MGDFSELTLGLDECPEWSGALQLIRTVVVNTISGMSENCQIRFLNDAKRILHENSPLRNEPVDCVLWVPSDEVEANDYNPNQVAPPEMRLLEHSIASDGYTQPVVTWLHDGGGREIIDGFHRGRVGRESKTVQARTHGYLPVTTVNTDRVDREDRIASTIRHNRARGKHQVQAMSEIVVELTRRNWSEKRIGKELGMDADEVLRLKQITGLAELFADREFSEAWE